MQFEIYVRGPGLIVRKQVWWSDWASYHQYCTYASCPVYYTSADVRNKRLNLKKFKERRIICQRSILIRTCTVPYASCTRQRIDPPLRVGAVGHSVGRGEGEEGRERERSSEKSNKKRIDHSHTHRERGGREGQTDLDRERPGLPRREDEGRRQQNPRTAAVARDEGGRTHSMDRARRTTMKSLRGGVAK